MCAWVSARRTVQVGQDQVVEVVERAKGEVVRVAYGRVRRVEGCAEARIRVPAKAFIPAGAVPPLLPGRRVLRGAPARVAQRRPLARVNGAQKRHGAGVARREHSRDVAIQRTAAVRAREVEERVSATRSRGCIPMGVQMPIRARKAAW